MRARLSPRLYALFAFSAWNLFFFAHAYSQPVRLDSARVAAFMDGLMAGQLSEKHIAGATVAVVQNGRILFTKGYGYADLESRKEVDPAKTLFRIGSISKTFIWTAVMQLVREGKLDLNADVNKYCKDFQVPATFPQPVTLLDLMNHTPGFEDRVLGLFAKDPEALKPLGAILAADMPRRVWAPGQISAYSNHGSGIAAYIVEQVSGLSWDAYIERHILQPLGMQRTTFRQPVPAGLQADLSKGYKWANGKLEAADFEYIPLAPVGAASASAVDMARYMLAHLQLGKLDTIRILDSLTARQMQRPSFRHAPAMNPMRHGFMDVSTQGQIIFGHGGDTELFHALMALFPDQQLGLFVAFNSADAGGVYSKTLEAFTAYFFPQPTLPDLKPDTRASLDRFAGNYRANRFSRSDLTRIIALLGTTQVVATPDGYLEIRSPDETIRCLQVDSLTFREVSGDRLFGFRLDAKGTPSHLFLGELPVIALERIPAIDQPALNFGLLGGSVSILLLTLIGPFIGIWQRQRYGIKASRARLLPTSARWTAWLAALLAMLFLLLIASGVSDQSVVLFGLPTFLKNALYLPFIIALLALGVLWHMLRNWAKGYGRFSARLWYTLVFLSLAGFLWFCFHWRFVGGLPF